MKNSQLVKEILQASEAVFVGIEQSTFYTTLVAGTLSSNARQLFIEQDLCYLRKYTEAVREVAKRLSTPAYSNYYQKESLHLTQFALRVEAYVTLLQKTTGTLFQPRIVVSAVIADYTRHLYVTTKHGSIEAALACLTPCLYIYHRRLGETIKALGCLADHPDRTLLESFIDPEFFSDALAVETMLNAATTPMESTSDDRGAEVKTAFSRSAAFELAFFDYLASSTPEDVDRSAHVASP